MGRAPTLPCEPAQGRQASTTSVDVERVPADWIAALELREEILALADDLFRALAAAPSKVLCPSGDPTTLRSLAGGASVTPTSVASPAAAPLTEAQTDAFYRASTLGLAWLDARESAPRRFGSAADASWRNYAGTPTDLTELDRLELLLRDAASLYPDAFSPRAVFAIPGLTDDEPFGQWSHVPAPGLARDAFRAPPPSPAAVPDFLAAAARAWSVALGKPSPLPPIGPTTRVLVVGAAALVEVAGRFAENRDLSFGEQVVVLTDSPALRHLAGLAALALGELRAPRWLPPDVSHSSPAAEGVSPIEVLASSDDASTDERTAAEALLALHRR